MVSYMPESYLSLSPKDQKEILQSAAIQLGRKENVLEKDVWVCWVLETMFSIPGAHPMAFKGGTSLSKVYEIIDRFSEDVDITLDFQQFNDTDYGKYPEIFDPFADGVSKTQISKYSDRLKNYVKSYAINVVVPHIQSKLDELPTKDAHSITIDDSGEKIWLSYPSVTEQSDEYLKANVLIELGGRNVIDPNETHSVTPYIASITKGVTYPTGKVVVLSPARTFWEKATLIHVECNRSDFKQNAERLSRHWYDLVMLSKHPSSQGAIANKELLEDVVKLKKVFYNSGYSNYDSCLAGSLKLIPDQASLDQLAADYKTMVSSGMMYRDPLSFDELIAAVKNLEREINEWRDSK